MGNFLKIGSSGSLEEGVVDWIDVANKPETISATYLRGDDAEDTPSNTQYTSNYSFAIDGSNILVILNGLAYHISSGRFSVNSTTEIEFISACADSDEITILVVGNTESGSSNLDLPDENTLLLCHFENTIEDAANRNTFMPYGKMAISKAQKKFGNTSLYFPGESYIDIPSRENFNFEDNEFTIDFWLRPETPSAWTDLINNYSHPSFDIGWTVAYNTDLKLNFSYSTDGTWPTSATQPTWSTTTLTLNAWQHIAVVRDKTSELIRMFKDGIEQAASNTKILNTVSIFSPIANLPRLGARSSTANYYYKGYIDELRISNIARWTSNFTPPAMPY